MKIIILTKVLQALNYFYTIHEDWLPVFYFLALNIIFSLETTKFLDIQNIFLQVMGEKYI